MFINERQLVEELTSLFKSPSAQLPRSLKCKNQMVLEEVNLGYGVADIVLTQYSEPKEQRDVFLGSTEIRVLHVVKKYRGASTEKISERTGLPKWSVKKSIALLESLELVRMEDGFARSGKPYVKIIKKTIAIEAKLYNWKRALKQAYRYKWFSDRSYVCLPSNRVKPALSNIKMFEDMGVGLLETSPGGGINILHNPKAEKPFSKEMNFLLNEWVLTQIHASL
jgi:predicted transcriptional regulator